MYTLLFMVRTERSLITLDGEERAIIEEPVFTHKPLVW